MNATATATLDQNLRDVLGLMAADRTTLADIVSCIVDRADPIRVILFGSCARGQSRATSDVDLLVVVPDGMQLREQWSALLDAVALFPLEADVIVTTPEEFAWRSQVPGFIQHAAMRDGRVLYERR